jgi:hypothetical protein
MSSTKKTKVVKQNQRIAKEASKISWFNKLANLVKKNK